MKKVYRFEDNKEYWDRRWSESGSDYKSFTDLNIYPIKYAEMVMKDRSCSAVELGCGLGRLVKNYHYQGFKISGLERSEVAIEKIKAEDPALDVRNGDVMNLPYADGQFDTVLAFGLYHNLESGLESALAETARCLKAGGRFCISMRPDNVEMNLNELYWRWKSRNQARGQKKFHKLLVRENEFQNLLETFGMVTDSIHRARNVSLLYRIPFLRETGAKKDEGAKRSEGYRLNPVGKKIDQLLMNRFSKESCNVLVYIGHKVKAHQ